MKTKFGLFLTTVALTVLVQPARAEPYCALRPPPEGLVERCHSRVFVIPDTLEGFRFDISSWMDTCVSTGRGVGLVADADESVVRIWELVQGMPNYARAVRITPKYEPLKFTEAGRTCYGVKSVEFSIRRGAVDADGQIVVSEISAQDVITDEMIKTAAAAAKRVLASPDVEGSRELSLFLGVLDGMERYGKEFDARYYPVAPTWAGLDAYACYKEYSVQMGGYSCLQPDNALKQCERNLAVDLVNSYHYLKTSPDEFAVMLQEKSNDIRRGVDHLLKIYNGLSNLDEMGVLTMAAQDPENRGMCFTVTDVLAKRVGGLARRGKTTVYGYY